MIVSSTCEQFSLPAICEWLRDGTSPTDLDLTTDRPWARTYKITGRNQSRFLKVLPQVQRGSLSAMSKISNLFPNAVPRVLAVDAERGLLLLEDHAGEDHHGKGSVEVQQKILATYAQIQAIASKQSDLIEMLPVIPLDQLMLSLLAFLNPESSSDRTSSPASGKDFFDVEKCQYYF